MEVKRKRRNGGKVMGSGERYSPGVREEKREGEASTVPCYFLQKNGIKLFIVVFQRSPSEFSALSFELFVDQTKELFIRKYSLNFMI